MAVAPSSCAGMLAKAPLKEPTGVRAALTMTIAFEADISISQNGAAGYSAARLRWFLTLS